MQHLVVRASKPAHLQAEDWAVNGVGRKGELGAESPREHSLPEQLTNPPLSAILCSAVSHHYGYGLLDAGLLVELAKAWAGTRPQRRCSLRALRAPR